MAICAILVSVSWLRKDRDLWSPPTDIYKFMGRAPVGAEGWNEWEDIVDGEFVER